MSEHSIDELKRQLQQAEGRLKAAQHAYADANRRLQKALADETGWIGKKATRGGRSIVVQDIQFVGDRPFKVTGFKLNRDGRPGRVEVSFIIDGDTVEFTDYEIPSNGNGK